MYYLSDVASAIGVTEQQVRTLIKQGIIPDPRPGRGTGYYYRFTEHQYFIVVEAFANNIVNEGLVWVSRKFDLDGVVDYLSLHWDK